MINKKILEYIKKCKKKGFSHESIKNKLVDAGHDSKSIEEHIDMLNKKTNLIKKGLTIIFVILLLTIIFLIAMNIINDIGENKEDNGNNTQQINQNNQKLTQEKRELNQEELDILNQKLEECKGMPCCDDSDCEDGDPNTKNICSGEPKACYSITYEECNECTGDFALSFAGGGGDSGGSDKDSSSSSTQTSADTNENEEEIEQKSCLSQEDCLNGEECINGFCNPISCLDNKGKNCDLDQTCDGKIIYAVDNPRCCLGNCILSELKCIAGLKKLASVGCDAGCNSCYCNTNESEILFKDESWSNNICLNLPSLNEFRWFDYPIDECEKSQILTTACMCGDDFCGYTQDGTDWNLCNDNNCVSS